MRLEDAPRRRDHVVGRDVAVGNAFAGNVSNFKSKTEDVDLESAITELMTRQTAYQAAMLATSKVLGTSLTDYLR